MATSGAEAQALSARNASSPDAELGRNIGWSRSNSPDIDCVPVAAPPPANQKMVISRTVKLKTLPTGTGGKKTKKPRAVAAELSDDDSNGEGGISRRCKYTESEKKHIVRDYLDTLARSPTRKPTGLAKAIVARYSGVFGKSFSHHALVQWTKLYNASGGKHIPDYRKGNHGCPMLLCSETYAEVERLVRLDVDAGCDVCGAVIIRHVQKLLDDMHADDDLTDKHTKCCLRKPFTKNMGRVLYNKLRGFTSDNKPIPTKTDADKTGGNKSVPSRNRSVIIPPLSVVPANSSTCKSLQDVVRMQAIRQTVEGGPIVSVNFIQKQMQSLLHEHKSKGQHMACCIAPDKYTWKMAYDFRKRWKLDSRESPTPLDMPVKSSISKPSSRSTKRRKADDVVNDADDGRKTKRTQQEVLFDFVADDHAAVAPPPSSLQNVVGESHQPVAPENLAKPKNNNSMPPTIVDGAKLFAHAHTAASNCLNLIDRFLYEQHEQTRSAASGSVLLLGELPKNVRSSIAAILRGVIVEMQMLMPGGNSTAGDFTSNPQATAAGANCPLNVMTSYLNGLMHTCHAMALSSPTLPVGSPTMVINLANLLLGLL